MHAQQAVSHLLAERLQSWHIFATTTYSSLQLMCLLSAMRVAHLHLTFLMGNFNLLLMRATTVYLAMYVFHRVFLVV